MATATTTSSNKRRIEELCRQVLAKNSRFKHVPPETIQQEIQTALGYGDDLDDRVVVHIAEGRLDLEQVRNNIQELDEKLEQLRKNRHEREQEAKPVRLGIQEREQKAKQEYNIAEQEVKQWRNKAKRYNIAGALALTETDSGDCKLVNRGTQSSHTCPKDEPAQIEPMEFPFKAIPNSDSFTGTSALKAKFHSEDWTYANEHDLYVFVHAVLQDAVVACNAILKRIANPDVVPIELSIRQESRWDSNHVDHSVVIDSHSSLPVFEIERIQPVDEPLQDPKLKNVAGQAFNQLSAMNTFGHPNPFAALTTFDETRIVWLDTPTSKQVLDDFNRKGMTDDWIHEIISKLSIVKKQPLESSVVPIKLDSSSPTRQKKAMFTKAQRRIQMSEALRVHQMLPALINAILCSLDGFKAEEPLVKLNENILLDRTALKLEKESHEWGHLQVQCKGEAVSKPPLVENLVLFGIDFLGAGTTSKAYRAVSQDGEECVLKVYVREYDEDNNIVLDQEEFDQQARDAVSKEVKTYHKIYPDLQKHVFACQLNQLHYVVHPFFEPLEQPTKEEVENVKALLETKFAPRKIGFKDEDIGWEHIGTFQEQLYLFDLADLAKIKNPKAYIEKHASCLLESLPGEKSR